MFGGETVVGVSRTQGNVSLSSTETEYVAAGEVAKEVLFVWGISSRSFNRMSSRSTLRFLKTTRVPFNRPSTR